MHYETASAVFFLIISIIIRVFRKEIADAVKIW